MAFVYDLCVVGAGMTGAAAARHASLTPNYRVCLIGPPEPQVRQVTTGKEVFGAHYDEARITSAKSTTRPVWGILAQRSMSRYRDLEMMSGVHFYDRVGSLTVGTRNSDYVRRVINHARGQGVMSNFEVLDSKQLKSKFPFFNFSSEDQGLMEENEAGIINPRKMVMAQISVASKNGCDVIRETVTGIVQQPDGNSRVVMGNGRLMIARKVLLATNVFTEIHNLLGNVRPLYVPMPQTVSLAEISSVDAVRLRNMPNVMYRGTGGPSWPKDYPRNSYNEIGFYLLPPVRYPDGKYYIKIGHHDAILKGPLQVSQIQKWYCGEGDKVLEEQMFRLLQGLLPDVKFLSHHGDACVTMVTPSYQPYVDLVTPTLGVVMGDNGWAAKSSDEIGRVAAKMIVHSRWSDDLPKGLFKLYTNKTGPPPTSKL
ncbi:uncharacterized protein LOC110448083 [Mizuhopecten yessoensis]|uniref:Monomeric sarcosine oxidase n=1 Tax=Mizuhopecten yessoensis TaxID=6573 RepID=A0A210QTV5_MIZYE|nr:uncharacterized protein LOC110448083 [Mizuhopecten yessoensis]OWF52193.1 Monomeric sarcosine oxidase [Mizuhopecten yessoensis]